MRFTRTQNLIASAFACGLAAIAVLGSVASANAADPSAGLGTGKEPNIVFILADNLGYGEVGAYGGGTQLPRR